MKKREHRLRTRPYAINELTSRQIDFMEVIFRKMFAGHYQSSPMPKNELEFWALTKQHYSSFIKQETL